MKKSLSIISAVVLALSLTACDTSPETSGESSSDTSSGISEPVSGDSSSESGTTSDTPMPSGSEITAQFELPNGDPVDLTNAVVTGADGEIPLSDITNGNWANVTCDGVYLAEAVGVYYDNIANSDIFDEKEMKFTGAPETVVHEYKKYSVGDMFGDLKLTEASTSFSPYASNFKPRYFNGGSVRFEGTLTLTGKCRLTPEDKAYDIKRDIHFVPDAKSANLLPIMRYSFDDDGNEDLVTGVLGDFCYLVENNSLLLGNADNYPELDFSGFPMDGSCVDVRVTIDNIYFSANIEWFNTFRCDIIDLEIIR